MKINEVDPRNFDSDIDYYNALNAKPKARSAGEPRPSPAQQAADDDDAISQQRQAQHKAFTQKRAVKYVDQEGSAPNGKEYNKLYVIQAQDSATADHEEYMFDKNEWGAKKVVDVEKSKNQDGSVTHTLYIVDNHKYGLWKPWKNKPAIESSQNSFNHKPDNWSADFERRMKKGDAPVDHDWYRKQQERQTRAKQKQQGVAEGYQFKGPFPFDVDHMHGGRGINLPKAETKKYFTDKKQWQRAVDDINSSKYDDNSDYIGVTGRSTVEINGREWARWSDAQQKGYIELSSMSEQGVAEGEVERDKHYYLRNNIWRVMDGDELVHEYKPERYEVVGAKKLLAQFDDEGYDVTHVISPMGVVTYLYGKPVDEGMLDNPSEQDSPVAQAIIRRILMQRTDLLAKHGPEKVGQAVDDVADFVGDVDEIGSSDVSGWVNMVEEMLASMDESVTEGSNNLRSAVLSVIQGIYNGAQAGEDMIDNVSDELGDYFNDVKRSKDQTLRNAYQLMRQQGAEAEGDPLMMAQVAKQAIDMLSQPMAEAEANPKDVICVDVPLFIRLMEYAREDASTDMDLHDVAERLIRLSAEGETVSMSSYDEIVGSQKEIKEADMDLEQGRKNILSILKAAEQGSDAEIMVGGEPITLEYPEARFVGGRYKSFLKAGRQEEFLRALTDARAFDRIMTKMRAVLDKQKNFRGSVPGERGVGEAAPALAKLAGGLGVGMVAAAGAPAIVGILGPLLGIPMAAYGAYSAAKLGMKGVEKLWDMASEKLGGDDKVEQYTQSKIATLPPEQAQAAKAVIKQVAESRRSMAPAVNEGIVDTIKAGAKKAFDKLGGGSDEELLQRLEKETGGKRPEKKDNEKVKESAPPGFDQDLEKKLLKQYKDNPERAYATMWTIHNKQKNESIDRALVNASAQLKENEYFCMLDKRVKQIPEGYKRTSSGYIVRK
jgi:hypothetical protein